MGKILANVAIILMLVPVCIANLWINEMIPNPQDGNEWVEVSYTGESPLDVSLLELRDNSYTDQIGCCIVSGTCNTSIIGGTYFLILDQDTTLPISNYTFCVDDNSIGNGLGNEGDNITLLLQGVEVSQMAYHNLIPKGLSLSYLNGAWHVTSPTPLYANSVMENKTEDDIEEQNGITISIILPEKLISGKLYKDIFKVTNLDYIQGSALEREVQIIYNLTKGGLMQATGNSSIKVNHHITSGTGEVIFPSPGKYVVCAHARTVASTEGTETYADACSELNVTPVDETCRASLFLEADRLIVPSGEKVSFTHDVTGKEYSFNIEYWIEDVYGRTVKSRIVTSNLNPKSYTPYFAQGTTALIVKSNLTMIGCVDMSSGDDYAEKIIVVKGERKEQSNITIGKVLYGTDNKFSFGETARVGINAYRGDTRNSTIDIWIEDTDGKKISKVTKVTISDTFSSLESSLPIQLFPNCDGKIGKGDKLIVAEGLGVSARQTVEIDGLTPGLCRQSVTSSASSGSSSSAPAPKQKQYILKSYSGEMLGDIQVAEVVIENTASEKLTYDAWSYIYKGSKCYSGEREDNRESFDLSPGDTKIVRLENRMVNAEPGNYSLKIKILKQGTKTPFEFTKPIIYSPKEELVAPVVPVESPQHGQSRIKSFFTRNTKFTGSINIYATIDNPSDCSSLVVSTDSQTLFIEDMSENMRLNLSVHRGTNVILARLYRNSTELDSADMIVYANDTTIETFRDVMLFHNAYGRGYMATVAEKVREDRADQDMITGMTTSEGGTILYQSSKKRSERYMPIILGLAIVTGVAAFVTWKAR